MRRTMVLSMQLWAWLFQSFVVVVVASSATNSMPTSPIRHWDASWAASCVQGTAIAMVHEDCAILFLRSPATNVWRNDNDDDKRHHDDDTRDINLMGLKVHRLHNDATRVQFAPQWLSFSNSLCALTGLASDVEHLSRILQRQVDNHLNVYGDILPTHTMTEQVGELFRNAAFAKGGRPFGVQAMLVGADDDLENYETKKSNHPKSFRLYTLDPSGSWQSWPYATAIGKFAKDIRTKLLSKKKLKPDNLEEALQHIIDSWVETCKAQNVNLKSNEDFRVFILRASIDSEECELYAMKRDDIDAMVEKSIEVTVK